MSNNHVNSHILPEFKYYAPKTIQDAAILLSEHGSEAAPLAGGTDLLVRMKQGLAKPKVLVDLKYIPELKGIRRDEDAIWIGAATGLRVLERSDIVVEELPLLGQAVRAIGSVQVRNLGTIGGNLCNASPSADSASALLALDAEAQLVGPGGNRHLPLQKFFLGPRRTAIQRGELLVSVKAPLARASIGSCFVKTARTSMDIASVNAAVALAVEDGLVAHCRIALGAVAPTPVRIDGAEAALLGNAPSDEKIEEAARLVGESVQPITDVRATAEYRRRVSMNLSRIALVTARGKMKGG